MVALNNLLLVLAGAISVQAIAEPNAKPKCCAADKCFASAKLPATYTPKASSFCQKYINKTPGTTTKTSTKTITQTRTVTPVKSVVTKTATVTAKPVTVSQTATVVPTWPTVTQKVTQTLTQVISTSCSVTVQTSFPTSVDYTSRGASPDLEKRTYPSKLQIPKELSSGCSSKGLEQKVSSACSCFLTKKTVTRTATATAYKTVTAGAQKTTVVATVTATPVPTTIVNTVTASVSTVTEFNTQDVTGVETTCTSTSTIYEYEGGFSCGIPSPSTVASGSISCTEPAPAGETNSFFRIEGNTSEGTVFEGCIISGPRNITTPSGGTHLCDGTNGNANPSPGATLTTCINDAGTQEGFDFDGSYNTGFQDFFITRISQTDSTSSQFWGVLKDRTFTSAGGCSEQVVPGVEGLWAFDAFNANAFLKLSPQYQVVRAGDTASVTVTVTGKNGDGAGDNPIGGASVGGQTSDSNGNVQIQVPDTPGCYQFKAQRSGTIRSNAFFLTVLAAEDGANGGD